MLAILPIAVTALQMQSTQAEVEHALVDGVRDRMSEGWTVVGQEHDYDEVAIVLTKGTQIERHVVHMDNDTGNAYRVDVGGKKPKSPWVSGMLLLALRQNGGVEITDDCGRLDLRPYLVEARARGASARKLVAETLKASDDLELANVDGDVAVFGVETGGRYAEVHVALDEGKVVEAEVRSYENNPDMTTFARQQKLKRKLGASVQTILDGETGPVLVGTNRRFEIDTTAFESNNPDADGCGC